MFSHAENINNWAVGHDSKLRPINIRQSLCKTIHNYDSHPGGLDTLKCSVIRLYSHHRLTSTILVYQSTLLALGFYSCASRNRESDALQVGLDLFLCQNVFVFFSFFLFLATSLWSEIGGRQRICQAHKRALVTTFRPGQRTLTFLDLAVFSSLELNHLFVSRYCE